MLHIAELLVQGMLLGVIYSLIAFPISLLFITTGSVDFAVGGYAVLASATAMIVGGATGIALGIGVAVLASVLVGIIGIRLNRPSSIDHLTVVLATVGVSTFLESAVLTFVGKDPMIRQPFEVFWNIAGIRVSPQAGINIAVGVVLVLALYFLLYRTSFGRDMRASAANSLGATLAGIPVRRIWFGTYVVGGFLAGVAGQLVLYTVGTDYAAGPGLTMSGFGAAVLFGLTSPLHGFLGGLAIGMVQALASGLLPGGWATAAPMLFIFLMLVSGQLKISTPAGGRA